MHNILKVCHKQMLVERIKLRAMLIKAQGISRTFIYRAIMFFIALIGELVEFLSICDKIKSFFRIDRFLR